MTNPEFNIEPRPHELQAKTFLTQAAALLQPHRDLIIDVSNSTDDDINFLTLSRTRLPLVLQNKLTDQTLDSLTDRAAKALAEADHVTRVSVSARSSDTIDNAKKVLDPLAYQIASLVDQNSGKIDAKVIGIDKDELAATGECSYQFIILAHFGKLP